MKDWIKQILGSIMIGVGLGLVVDSSWNMGFSDCSKEAWKRTCDTYGLDPKNSAYSHRTFTGQHSTAQGWIDRLNTLDPEERVSGKLIVDSSVEVGE